MKRQPVRRSVHTCTRQLFSLSMAVVFVMLLGLVALTPLTITASAAGEPVSLPVTGKETVPVYYTESTVVTITETGWYYIEAWGGNGGNGGERRINTDDGWNETEGYFALPGDKGGKGGESLRIAGSFYFEAGDTLQVKVGAAGADGSPNMPGGDFNHVLFGGPGGAGGTDNTATGLGSGYKGGAGGNTGGDTTENVVDGGAGGGGGGGAASGVLLNGTDKSNIIIASGGGGGGGGAAYKVEGGDGGRSGEGGESGESGGGGAVAGNYWNTNSTDGYHDSNLPRHDGAVGVIGGGGAGGGGGGWDGMVGGGGQSGSGGAAGGVVNNVYTGYSGGGGAGGASFCSKPIKQIPEDFSEPAAQKRYPDIPDNPDNPKNPNGLVYITFIKADTISPTPKYNVTVNGSNTTSSGAGSYAAGDEVTIDAGTRKGYRFTGWIVNEGGTDILGSGSNNATTTFIMPGNDVEVTANWVQEFDVKVNGSNTTSSGAGSYEKDKLVTISAGTREGYRFTGWTVDKGGVTLLNSNSATTTFTMPGNDVEVTANWVQEFDVKVNGSNTTSSGAGSYEKDKLVTISAGTREGYRFTGWTVDKGGVTLLNSNNATTTFIMPGNNVTVTANWALIEDNTPPVVTPPVVTPPEVTTPDPTEPVDPQDSTDPADPVDPQPTPPEPTPVPVQPYIPGGNDFYTPPVPMVSNSTLVADEDGGWLELDEDGVPLGKWAWDGDEWVFEDYGTPLSNLPMTSIEDNIFFYAAALCLLLAASAYFISRLIQLRRNSKSQFRR